jgi:acetylglutamate kinase
MEHEYTSPLAARPIVVKYGGNALPSKGDPLLAELLSLWTGGRPVVLVHGGGPEIDRWLQALDHPTRRVDGLRVTDETTLQVTEAVLCATINKRLVRACVALGARAAGISGEDGGTLIAQRAQGSHGEDLGYVGDVVSCDPSLIEALLAANYMPVVAPLAVAADAAHAYNVNADLAAAAIAGALRADFVVVTDVPRVLRDPNDPSSAIDRLSLDQARAFAQTPACAGGMLPKIRAAIAAVESGADASYICGTQPLTATLAGNATVISTKDR